MALVGQGLIGRERLRALHALRDTTDSSIEIVGILDPYVEESDGELITPPRLRSLADLVDCKPDQTFVAVPHDSAVPIALELLRVGCRVHLEKPMGMNLSQAQALYSASQPQSQLTVGFNYPFMAGVAALLNDMQSGQFGDVISVSMILGHGGSPGDGSSWKLDPLRSGGGCLLDPGVHLLHLCKLMFGDVTPVSCLEWTGFWNTGIEEEATVTLFAEQTIINISLSIVHWRSTFRIEVNGTLGYGRVEGRGRSYGKQIYTRGERWAWRSGRNQAETEKIVGVDDCDDSFFKETKDVLCLSSTPSQVCTDLVALEVMELLDEIRGLSHRLQKKTDSDGLVSRTGRDHERTR